MIPKVQVWIIGLTLTYVNSWAQCPAVGVTSVGQNLSNYVVSSSYNEQSQELYVSGYYDQETFTIDGHSINGVVFDHPAKRDLYLMKLTPELEVDWLINAGKSVGLSTSSRLLAGGEEVYAALQFVDTVTFASQDFVVENGGFYENALLIKISQQGNIDWIHQFNEVTTSQINAIGVDMNGMIYVVGSYSDSLNIQGQSLVVPNPQLANGEVFIAKLKANGDLIWLRHLGGGAGNDVGYSLKCTSNGLFVSGFFQGTLDIGTSSFSSPLGTDGFVASVDTGGVAVWAVHLNGATAVRNEEVIPFKNGCVVAGWFNSTLSVAQHSVTSNGDTDFFLLRLDESGNPIWLKNIGGNGADDMNRLESINDDLFMISGSSSSSYSVDGLSYVNHASAQGAENGIALLLDSIGTVQCLYEMPSENGSSTMVEYLGGDSIALVGGFVEDLSIQNMSLNVDGTTSVIVKRCMGCDGLTSLDAASTENGNFDLALYPNPATNIATITLPKTGAYDLNVIDATGRVVCKDRDCHGRASLAMTGSFELNTRNWPQGIYAITATNQNGSRYTGRLVVGR